MNGLGLGVSAHQIRRFFGEKNGHGNGNGNGNGDGTKNDEITKEMFEKKHALKVEEDGEEKRLDIGVEFWEWKMWVNYY